MVAKTSLKGTTLIIVALALAIGCPHCPDHGQTNKGGPVALDTLADTAWPCFMQNREQTGQSGRHG